MSGGFRLAPEDSTWWWPVTVDVPQDGGETQPVRCRVKFRLLKRSKHRELLTGGTDGEFLAAALADWRHVEDADGKALPCDAESVAKLAEIPYFARAVISAYADFASGIAAKN